MSERERERERKGSSTKLITFSESSVTDQERGGGNMAITCQVNE